VALEREDQGDVDRDAGGNRLLDRGQALAGRGDLDQQVGLLDERVQALGLVDRALRVVREVRVDLERDPAVLATAASAMKISFGSDSVADISRIWSSYASPSAIAPWKIVGLEVTPTTPSRTKPARSPSCRNLRER
jgi:hypothetical protein